METMTTAFDSSSPDGSKPRTDSSLPQTAPTAPPPDDSTPTVFDVVIATVAAADIINGAAGRDFTESLKCLQVALVGESFAVGRELLSQLEIASADARSELAERIQAALLTELPALEARLGITLEEGIAA